MRSKSSFYIGVLVISLGVITLFAQATRRLGLFGVPWGWRAAWPLFVLWAGAAFLLPVAIWWERRREIAGLVVPGTVLTTTGLILLFQNVTGLWGTWSFLWALEPIAVGLSLLMLYYLLDRPAGLLIAASIVGGVGLLMLLIFSGMFTFLGPLMIIVLGVLLVLAALGRGNRRQWPQE